MCKDVQCQDDISIQDSQIAKAPTRFYEFRDLKQLDSQEFDDYIILQISKLNAFSVQCHSADEVATRFNDLIQDSVNKFAPCTMHKISKPKSNKYKYVAEITDAKQSRRALERKYLKTKTEIDKQLLKSQREVVRKLVDHLVGHSSVIFGTTCMIGSMSPWIFIPG